MERKTTLSARAASQAHSHAVTSHYQEAKNA
jgi:hypothetical protein